MNQVPRLLIMIGAMVCLALLVSCGQAQYPLQSPTQKTNKLTPLPTATTGLITLQVDAALYHTGDAISVALNNRSTQTIYFLDHQTNCTVIQLQQQVGGKWEAINNCGLGILSILHMLYAGQHLIVKLVAPHGQWPPGFYRAALRFYASDRRNSLTTIYSTGFQVIQESF